MTDPKNEITGETLSDEAESATDVDHDLNELFEQFQRANTEREQLKDQLLRTMADFQNFRKRVNEEKRSIEERANERFISELLPVLDNFERGLATMDSATDIASVKEGVRAVDRQLRSVLEGQKVTRIESLGKPFDPELHEALATIESADQPDGTILDEIEPGYKMGDRVIRAARVRVSKRA